tara:strand:- start:547 stop:843 length:297 start_codon:yes stop_codon:yes gene_type:complete
MEYLWGGIIALIILQIVILKVLIELNREIKFGLEELDQNIAGAIASVVEKFAGGGVEAVNPVQAAIAQLISRKAQEIPKTLTQRDESGKFRVNEILNP